MKKFFEIIKVHKYTVILAVILGLLSLYPAFASIYKNGLDNFRGVYPLTIDDEEYYMARAQEVVDGHPSSGNTYLSEHKDNSYMAPALGENIFGYIAKYTKIPVPLLFFINKFFLIFIGFILFYILIFSITGSKKIAIFISLLYNIYFIRDLGRPIHPQFSILFLYLGLLLIRKIYTNSDNIKKLLYYNAGLGIIFGLSIYTYPYFWTTIIASYLMVLLAFFILSKNLKTIFKSLAAFILPAIILAMPYLLNLLKASSSPYYLETTKRLGLITTYFPGSYYNAILIIYTLIFFILIRKKITNINERYFSFSLLITALALNWQNIITGKYLFFSGHYNQALFILILIVYGVIFKNIKNSIEFNDRKKLYKNGILIIGIILFFSFTGYKKIGDIKGAFSLAWPMSEISGLQTLAPVFDWFNSNTAKDSVIYVLGTYNDNKFPVYTHNNLYYFGYAGLGLISDNEMEDRWVRQNIFRKDFDEDYILKNNVGIWHLEYLAGYQNKEVKRKLRQFITKKIEPESEYVPMYKVEKVLNKYSEIKKQDLREALKEFQIDYIMLATDDKIYEYDYSFLVEEFKKYQFIKPLEKIGAYYIYQVL